MSKRPNSLPPGKQSPQPGQTGGGSLSLFLENVIYTQGIMSVVSAKELALAMGIGVNTLKRYVDEGIFPEPLSFGKWSVLGVAYWMIEQTRTKPEPTSMEAIRKAFEAKGGRIDVRL